MEKISDQEDLSVEDLSLLARWYQILYMFEKAGVFAEKIREKDPRGEFVQDERYQKISGTADIKEKIKLFEKFKNDFPKSSRIPMIQYEITQYYKTTGDFEALVDYTEKNLEGMDWSVLHSITWDIAEAESDIGRAEELGRAAVERARKELESSEDEKPSYVTEKDWKKQSAYILGEVLGTYGYVLFKLDKHKEAKVAYEEAIKLNQGKNSEMNERYAQILVEVEDPEIVLSEIGRFIEIGNSTSKMKELLKDVYVRKNGSEQGFDLYLKELELVPRKKLMARLKKKMINIPASKFSLNDLEGNTVSLSDLKGKVVVLDFWATWCGYCIQSFPAMKKAVEKYKDDESVKFLFVNTLERVENRKEIASKFISQNNYPFQVLLDLEDKIVMAYGAEALPTKIIIDGKGRIRFKEVGFSGNSEKMLEELITKIEMIR